MQIDVIVVNTAARSGGALTILKQFINSISKYSPKNINYHIFVSQESLKEYISDNINIIVVSNGSNYIKRVFYEKKFIKNWCKDKNMKPKLIISLQNIGVSGFNGIPQIIYLHQPIPFRKDLKWSIFKKDEIRYWLYKNLYSRLIKSWSKKVYCFIVQTNWMKEALIEQFKMSEKEIFLVRPDMQEVDVESVKEIDLDKDYINIFYPTSDVKYKNYLLLFDIMKELNKDSIKYKLYITLSRSYAEEVSKYNMESIGVICVGIISYEEVLQYYKSVDILTFPSYLETFGLPLIEGASFGLPIVASDLSYANEVLKNYGGARFAKYDDVSEWVSKIRAIKLEKNIYGYSKDEFTGWDKLFNIIVNCIDNGEGRNE